MIIPEYTCCRCGYKVKHKSCMRYHLFQRKTLCPSLENKIDLTENIKNEILENRIYKIPKIEKLQNATTIINNKIQYNNTINNFIKNMDPLDKLDKYMNYKDLEILCLEENIEDHFSNRVKNLENDSFKFGYDIDENRLFDIIDEISKIKRGDFKQMNIIYDEKLKELNLYKSGTWETLIVERGSKEVIEILKDNFLDYYEKYLLKKIYITEINEQLKAKHREDLERHYKFLGCFDIFPYVKGKDNMDILGETDGDYGKYCIEEKWMSKYKDIVDNTKRYEMNKIKKNIIDIIKNNTKRNIKDLNKAMIDLLNIDEEFKKNLEP